MKSFKTHILENKDHVETHMDVMVPDSHDTPTKAKKWISNYVKKKGGPSNKLSHYTYDGPGGGHPAVSVKGHVSHIMKLHNHHNDEKFSHDHEGHKKMSKEYGFDRDKNHLMKRESVNEKSEFGMAHDIVRKHSKGSEVRGSGDGTTVTAEHPKGQNATKDERMAHTNMLKDKLKHLKSVKVVHKTYPGSATEQNVKEYGMVYSNKNKKGKITPPYPAAEDHADKKKKKEVSEISFRPNDDTSLGNRYANKVMSGDYSSKKIDNRKKGIATMTYKRAAQKGVPGVAKVPFKDHVEKDENMSIREKLISVVERANHGNTEQETYDDMYKGAGAKKMRKDHQNMKVDTTRALGVKDASAAGAKAIKKAPMRRADNAKGDTNIVPAGTPMKDPAASKDMALENVMAAYKSMNKE